MLTISQAVILGALQGLTELFPISSLGHTVILPSVFGWQVDQHNPLFLSFIIATHLATALVLLGFFWREWVGIVLGVLRSLARRTIDTTPAKLGWLLIVGTVPAGLLGLVLQKKFEVLFAAPRDAALFLALNGILLFGAELLRRKRTAMSASSNERITKLTWGQAVKVGLMQCLALLPGFSRTGTTLAGGLWEGLSHEDAARFSFLLATPIITAAAVLKLPHLAKAGAVAIDTTLVGAACAALAAYLSVKFLTRYFKTNTLTPFATYCLVAGIVFFFLL